MANYTADPARGFLAAVRGGVVLLLPASSAPTVSELWPALVDSDPVRVVLDRLTADGFQATPPFGLAVRSDDGSQVRTVVRGGFSVRIDGELVTGEGVSTWVERVVQGSAVELRATDAAADPLAVALPIVEGVVYATAVDSTAVEPVSAASAPAVATAAPALVPEAPVAPALVPVVPAVAPVAPVAPVAVATPAPEPAVAPPAPAAWVPPVLGDPGATIAGPPPAAPPPAAPPAALGFDAVDDSTIVSPVGGISAATMSTRGANTQTVGGEQTIVPPTDTSADALGGDHDGLTVVGADVARLRAERDARRAGQSVSAQEHAPAASGAVAAPRLALRMPDGSIEPVTHEVLLGRAPSVSQVSGGRLPRVVAIGAGDQDISRNHVRVTVEGDTIVITDLHSRNGTHVAQPGKAPVRLRAGEPTPVLVGTVVDLGGGWTIQVVAA
ncbi:FHA domain-containing protein [Agromyces sp. CF514]|uniref:FHA domain-containing protein n=1 Tax=Agromyces sp. CF514 TaxID=1881031 RepID=UPI0008E7B0B0|nr:FHA domain-containing protein [Agromyces sp. CF514]SFR75229.1 FHA domain-containing protein [Agromyces sp. CF514]